MDIILEGDLVGAIRPTGAPYRDEQVVATGGVVAPGLVDGHVHFDRRDVDVNEVLALQYLASGVTSVVCMYGTPAILKLREDVAHGRVAGPRVWTSGPKQNDPALTYEAGLAEARAQAALGYDGIKVYNDLSEAGYAGLLDGAREAGLPVVGHVVRAVGLPQTLVSGQAHVAHLEEFVYTHLDVNMDRLMEAEPVQADDAAIRQLAGDLIRQGITVGTTIEALSAASQQVTDAAVWCARPDVVRMPGRIRQAWLPPSNYYANRFAHPAHERAFKRLVSLVGQVAAVLNAAGVRLLAGSDALNCGVAPGVSLRRELRHLIRAGLSNRDAVRAATAFPMSDPGAPQRLITAGSAADLILLAGDPFQSVACLDGLRGVVAQGKWQGLGDIKREIRRATAHLDSTSADPVR